MKFSACQLLRVLLLVSVSVTTVTVKAGASCDDHPDLVTHLPGYPEGQPPACWYSGYLHYEVADQQVHTHYTLITAELDQNQTKPLIYWSNGGPGASSLFGLLTELGPLLLSDLSLQTDDYRRTGIPTPIYNPHAWSRIGHLLSFDQPAPVGFSYCNSKEENAYHPHSCGGIAWTDELAAESSYKSLLAFYEKFPSYLEKDLFLTGESYAGIYIPTLAREIVRGKDERIQLKGFAVGDGCLGTETGICVSLSPDDPDAFDVWNLVFLAGHGQIPMDTFREVMRACRKIGTTEDEDEDFPQSLLRGMSMTSGGSADVNVNDPICQDALKKVERQVGGVYEYGLYDECTYSNGMLTGGLNDYPCGGDIVMAAYLALPAVQEALHVESEFFSIDNAEGDFDYTPTETDLTGFYKEMNGKLRILVYNGDADPAINSFAAQNWTSHLGLKETEAWSPWSVDGCRRMGGYVTRYEGDFDFLTIRGAGHMVPAIKAEAAFAFMKSWIEGTDYPVYDKDCTAPGARIGEEHGGRVMPE